METNPLLTSETSTPLNEQPCSTCIKYYQSMKESILQLDLKMNLILTKMEEIIGLAATQQPPSIKELSIKQAVTDLNGGNESDARSSSSIQLSPHDATRSATEEDEDLVYPIIDNKTFNKIV
uniref:Uncharacterized protein n=1 Tax=Panagrolaimus davidi TaxID=227884 RepID=A0A914P8V5_9BILA